MPSFLVFVALISISHVVKSTPQFSQSFSSSNVLKPNGEVISNSIYTDSQGNKITNGSKNPPSLFNFLLPPLGVHYEPVGPQTPPPVYKPGKRPTEAATTTQRPTPPTKPSQVTPKATVKFPVTARTTVKIPVTPKPTVKFPVKTTLKPKPHVNRPNTLINSSNTGAYVHDDRGTYKHDDRGKWRPGRYNSGAYRRN